MKGYWDARQRLWRAKTHRDEFGKQWSDFLDDDPYDPYVHVEDDWKGSIEVGSRYEGMPPIFSFLLGETMYHLRAALDCCVYYAAILDSGQNPPPNEQALEFPICRTVKTWEHSAGKIAPLSDEHRAIIKTVQPCFADEVSADIGWASSALGMLHDWARIDRHRRMNVLGSWGANRNPQLRLPEGTSLLWMTVNSDGFLEHEGVIARFALEGWQTGMQIEANPDLTIDIAADEEPPPRDDSDTLSLRTAQMVAMVDRIIKLFEQAS